MEFANKNLQGDKIAKTTYLQHLFCGQNWWYWYSFILVKIQNKDFSPGLYALIGQWSSNLPIAKIQEIKTLHSMETLGPLISSISLLWWVNKRRTMSEPLGSTLKLISITYLAIQVCTLCTLSRSYKTDCVMK